MKITFRSAHLLTLLLIPLWQAKGHAKGLIKKPIKPDVFNLAFEHEGTQLIVKFKSQTAFVQTAQLKNLGGLIEHTFANKAHLISFPSLLQNQGMQNQGMQNQALQKLAATIARLPNVEYVEANTRVHALESKPNDPSFSSLWGLEKIAAPKAWELATSSRAALVGVIDTGIDINHPDVVNNSWKNPGEQGKDSQGRDKATNGIDDDNNGFIDDWRGWDFVNNDNNPHDDNRHGTHCAGTIGASGNNGLGVAGVSWKASLVGIKFLDAQGSGTLSDAVKAVDYGVKIGASVLSNSWGGGGFSQTMEDAIKRADKAGVLFVAAAGNSSADNDQNPHYPSNYQVANVLAVAATDPQDHLASFSHFGLRTVHLGAPGVSILSTTPQSTYSSLSGTSMATPHVAGAAALLRATKPHLSLAQVKEKILQSVDTLPTLVNKTSSGGRLNLYNMLENDTTPPGPVSGLTAIPEGLTSLKVQFRAPGDDGEEGLASWYAAKISTSPITTEAEWLAAQTVRLTPTTMDTRTMVTNKASSAEQTFFIHALAAGSEGYLNLKARDNAGNWGSLTESLAYVLPPVQTYAYYPADSMDEVTADKPWGLEMDDQGRSFFSDSPNTNYANNRNVTLNLQPLTLNDPTAVLRFETLYDLENRFDFAVVEISWDLGKTWLEALKLTGQSGSWVQKTVPLTASLGAPKAEAELRVRFRLVSDYSIAKDGIKLDNITILAADSAFE